MLLFSVFLHKSSLPILIYLLARHAFALFERTTSNKPIPGFVPAESANSLTLQSDWTATYVAGLLPDLSLQQRSGSALLTYTHYGWNGGKYESVQIIVLRNQDAGNECGYRRSTPSHNNLATLYLY